jgi:hypothetical protein
VSSWSESGRPHHLQGSIVVLVNHDQPVAVVSLLTGGLPVLVNGCYEHSDTEGEDEEGDFVFGHRFPFPSISCLINRFHVLNWP